MATATKQATTQSDRKTITLIEHQLFLDPVKNSPYWYVRMTVNESGRRYKRISTGSIMLSEAKAFAFDKWAEIRALIKIGEPIFAYDFSRLVQEYTKHLSEKPDGQLKTARFNTIKINLNNLNKHFANIDVQKIDSDAAIGYFTARKNAGITLKDGTKKTIADTTINLELQTLKAMLKWISPKLKTHEIDFSSLKITPKSKREALSDKELDVLKQYLDNMWKNKKCRSQMESLNVQFSYHFVYIMLNTGMRPSAARNLKWKDVEYKKDYVVLHNLTGKDHIYTAIFKNDIAKWFEAIRAISIATKESDYVFINMVGEENNALYDKMVSKIFKGAGLERNSDNSNRTSYTFRHTYITNLLKSGATIDAVSRNVGNGYAVLKKNYDHTSIYDYAAELIKPDKNGQIPGAYDTGINVYELMDALYKND